MATMTALATTTLGSSTGTITFSAIPQTYTDLKIVISARTDAVATTGSTAITFNGDSSAIYARIYLQGNGSATTSVSNTGAVSIGTINAVGASATADTFSNVDIYIPNYVSSNYKTVSIDAVSENNATLGTQRIMTGIWSSASPITSITLTSASSNFVQYTTATLYGVFSGPETLPSTPTIGTATAGDASASVTFTPTSATNVDASYTVISTPGSLTGTGASSPVTVSGLTNGTAYTFQVRANNPGGSSAYSSASNSVTPVAPSWEYIARTTPTGTNSVTFTSIPEGYSALKIIGLANSNGDSILYTRMNSTGGTSYAEYAYFGGAGSDVTVAGQAASSSVLRRYACNAITSFSSRNAILYGTYFNANTTNPNKTVHINSGYNVDSSGGSPNLDFTFANGVGGPFSAKIDSITLGTGNGPGATNFIDTAQFTLYGLKEA
jgi:hypothetical protein